MILHIGAREMVSRRDIVAIIKYEGLTATKGGCAYLKAVQDRGKLLDICGGRPGSLVVLQSGACYLSPISAGTLLRRLEEDGISTLDMD